MSDNGFTVTASKTSSYKVYAVCQPNLTAWNLYVHND